MRTTLGPSFYFVDPVFFKPVGSQDPCFLCPSSNTVIYNIMSICINSSTPCISPIAKNTPYFLILPLIFTIAKNYSLVLNFTPYFHEQGVNYSFGKTLARALKFYGIGLAGGKRNDRVTQSQSVPWCTTKRCQNANIHRRKPLI